MQMMKLFLFTMILILFVRIGQAQETRWRPIGPTAGTADQIIPHRGIPNVVFVINNRHLYRSVDFGKHWKLVPLEKVLDLQIHLKTGVIVALTEVSKPSDPFFALESEFFFSVDGGETFRLLSHLNFYVRNFRIHPDNLDVFISWDVNVYKSVDGGRKWNVITGFPKIHLDVGYDVRDVVFSPFDPEAVFVSARVEVQHVTFDDLILQSKNVGKTWTIVLRNREKQGFFAYAFHHDDAFGNRVLAHGNRGILRLTADGWVSVSDFDTVRLISDPNRRSHLFAFRSDISDTCDEPLYESFDEGANWIAVQADLRDRLYSLAVLHDDFHTLLGSTNGGGLFRRDPERSWKPSDSGIKEGLILDISSGPNSSAIAFAFGTRFPSCNHNFFVYVKKNLNSPWTDVTFRLPVDPDHETPLAVEMDPSDPSKVYLLNVNGSGSFGRLDYSFDAGKTWEASIFDQDVDCIDRLIPHRQDSNILYAIGCDMFKSMDGGRTFQSVSPDFFGDGVRGIPNLVVDRDDPNVLYLLFSHSGIFKSTDAGATFNTLDGTPARGWSMAQLPGRNSFLLLSKGGRIYKTDNGGSTWTQISKLTGQGIFFTPKAQILSADSKGKHFFVTVNDSFLYESTDGGRSWKDITAEFGADIQVLDIDRSSNGTIFVATSRGVFQFAVD
jgi:photosystem II stability/assembly factor-like uncharacterized protein